MFAIGMGVGLYTSTPTQTSEWDFTNNGMVCVRLQKFMYKFMRPPFHTEQKRIGVGEEKSQYNLQALLC